MPHISKEKLDEGIYESLFSQMIFIQTGLSKKDTLGFVGDLLTDTEKIMMTKRCAAVLMFSRGCSSYEVWKTLKISQSTAANIKIAYEVGKYDQIAHIFKTKKKDRKEFMKTLNKALRLGMPSMGKERWESLNFLLDK